MTIIPRPPLSSGRRCQPRPPLSHRRHSPAATSPKTLTLTLVPHLPNITPSAIDSVLKLLWNDGPRALLFFRSLPRPSLSFSSLELAADIAARLRDSKTLNLILRLRRDLNLPLTPRTFSVLAERFASHGKPDRTVRWMSEVVLAAMSTASSREEDDGDGGDAAEEDELREWRKEGGGGRGRRRRMRLRRWLAPWWV